MVFETEQIRAEILAAKRACDQELGAEPFHAPKYTTLLNSHTKCELWLSPAARFWSLVADMPPRSEFEDEEDFGEWFDDAEDYSFSKTIAFHREERTFEEILEMFAYFAYFANLEERGDAASEEQNPLKHKPVMWLASKFLAWSKAEIGYFERMLDTYEYLASPRKRYGAEFALSLAAKTGETARTFV